MSKKSKKDKKKNKKEEQRTSLTASEKSGVKLDLRSVELPPGQRQ